MASGQEGIRARGMALTPQYTKMLTQLPVRKGLPDILPLELVRLANLDLLGRRGTALDVFPNRHGRLTLVSQSAYDKVAFLLGEERGRVGEVVDQKEGAKGDKDRDDAFQDEDPSPALKTANPIHLADAKGQKSTESACDGCGREKHGLAKLDFVSAIPKREVILCGRDQHFVLSGRCWYCLSLTATPGNRPASVTPKNKRATNRPW